jgi:hypothetical protein
MWHMPHDEFFGPVPGSQGVGLSVVNKVVFGWQPAVLLAESG